MGFDEYEIILILRAKYCCEVCLHKLTHTLTFRIICFLKYNSILQINDSLNMLCILFIRITRGRRSLQVLILQFNSRLLLLSLLVCLVFFCMSVRLSRVFTSRLLSNYCRDSAWAVFYTNGCRSFSGCEQNGGLM